MKKLLSLLATLGLLLSFGCGGGDAPADGEKPAEESSEGEKPAEGEKSE